MSDYDRNAVRWGQGSAQTRGATLDQGLRAYMIGVYNNMMIGLVVTGVVAFGVASAAVTTDPDQAVGKFGKLMLTNVGAALYTSPLRWVVMLAPLAFVFFLSMRINSMTASAARATFYAFAAVMGVSISSIMLVYTQTSIANAFFITAASFAGLSLYGYVTKRDLGPMGSFLIMGVIGLVLAGLVNMFVQSAGFSLALSGLTVLIFAGLTAYDTQKIKESYYAGAGYEVQTKNSIMGALMLYLDFINIFLALLRLTGSSRD